MTELPITGLPVGGVSPNVIVCGDPARADQVAAALDDTRQLSHRREYRAHRGSYRGHPITVCSHGVGAPGAAAAFEELIAAGGRRLIRVGTCGGMQPPLQAGHLVIATAAVRNTGYGREVVPDGYPAVADLVLTQALQRAATKQSPNTRSGLTLTRDAFYPGAGAGPGGAPAAPDYQVLSQIGVLTVEMECSALFLVGSLRQVQTAAILVVDGNVLEAAESMDGYQPSRPEVAEGVQTAIEIALNALASAS